MFSSLLTVAPFFTMLAVLFGLQQAPDLKPQTAQFLEYCVYFMFVLSAVGIYYSRKMYLSAFHIRAGLTKEANKSPQRTATSRRP